MPACLRCTRETADEYELVKRRAIFWKFFERQHVGFICRPCLDDFIGQAMKNFDIDELYVQAIK